MNQNEIRCRFLRGSESSRQCNYCQDACESESGFERHHPALQLELTPNPRRSMFARKQAGLYAMPHLPKRNVNENVERRGPGLALRMTEFHRHVSRPVIANHPIPRFAAQINNDLALSLPVESFLRFQISSDFRARHSDSESTLILSHLRLIADVQVGPDARGSRLPLFDSLTAVSGEEQSPRPQNGKNKKDDFGGTSHAASCHASSGFAINGLVIKIFRPQCPP